MLSATSSGVAPIWMSFVPMRRPPPRVPGPDILLQSIQNPARRVAANTPVGRLETGKIMSQTGPACVIESRETPPRPCPARGGPEFGAAFRPDFDEPISLLRRAFARE